MKRKIVSTDKNTLKYIISELVEAYGGLDHFEIFDNEKKYFCKNGKIIEEEKTVAQNGKTYYNYFFSN